MWFTETPWPPMALCAAAAAFVLFKWWTTHRGIFLVSAVLLLALAAGVYFVEAQIVTEAERIENNVHALAAAVKEDDPERVGSFFSPRAEQIRRAILGAMVLYDIADDMRITDLSVRLAAENTIATSHFRANGTISGKGSAVAAGGATRWRLTWQREGDDWKIIRVERLHPIRDNESLELLDRVD